MRLIESTLTRHRSSMRGESVTFVDDPRAERFSGQQHPDGPHNRALHPVGRAPRYPRVHGGGGGTIASGARAMHAQITRGAAAASSAEALFLRAAPRVSARSLAGPENSGARLSRTRTKLRPNLALLFCEHEVRAGAGDQRQCDGVAPVPNVGLPFAVVGMYVRRGVVPGHDQAAVAGTERVNKSETVAFMN